MTTGSGEDFRPFFDIACRVRDLRVVIAMLAAPCQRDHVIQVPVVRIDRQLTDTANTLITFKDQVAINMFLELFLLLGMARILQICAVIPVLDLPGSTCMTMAVDTTCRNLFTAVIPSADTLRSTRQGIAISPPLQVMPAAIPS